MNEPKIFSPGEQLLRLDDVCRLTTLSKVRLYELMKMNEFPCPVKIGRSRVAWLESEIYGYLNERLAMRDNDAKRTI